MDRDLWFVNDKLFGKADKNSSFHYVTAMASIRPIFPRVPESEIKETERVLFALVCDSLSRSDIRGILADYLDDLQLPLASYRVKEWPSILPVLHVLNWCGKSARSYRSALMRYVENVAGSVSRQRTNAYGVPHLDSAGVLGIPGDLEVPGYPLVDSETRHYVPEPGSVLRYQCSYAHILRLCWAYLDGVEVPADVMAELAGVAKFIRKDLIESKRIPWYGFNSYHHGGNRVDV